MENKVYNQATHSYVDKELYEEAIKKDKTNPNFTDRQHKLT
jgi:hypothetical protein